MTPSTREELIQLASSAPVRYRCFWLIDGAPLEPLTDACLSQWWPCRFTVDGQEYTSTEQFMMANKAALFGDRARREEMLATSDPGRIKALGRSVHPFDGERWAAIRMAAVKFGPRPPETGATHVVPVRPLRRTPAKPGAAHRLRG